MDPYREANAPPPPYSHDGPLPPYVPPHGAKFQEAAGPPPGPHYSQGPGGYQAYPGGYPPPQQQPQAYQPQAYQQQGYQPSQQQQHGYQPPQPPPRQAANPTATTVVVAPFSVGQQPMRVKCPSCQADIKSRVRRSNALKTHFVAVLLCLLCCWPCICVPYCMASCKDATHSCPNCKAFLGTYRA